MRDFRFLDRLVAPLGFTVPEEPAPPMSRKLKLLLMLPGLSPAVTLALIHWWKVPDTAGVARYAPLVAGVGIIMLGLYAWLCWRVTMDQHRQQIVRGDRNLLADNVSSHSHWRA